jgi:hypothetical protein
MGGENWTKKPRGKKSLVRLVSEYAIWYSRPHEHRNRGQGVPHGGGDMPRVHRSMVEMTQQSGHTGQRRSGGSVTQSTHRFTLSVQSSVSPSGVTSTQSSGNSLAGIIGKRSTSYIMQ